MRFFKILSKFSQNLGKNLENFGNMHLYGGSAPEASEIILKKLSRKINGNLQNFETFDELCEYFLFTR